MSACARCHDVVALAAAETPLARVSPSIWLFRCPQCGTLVLDDYYGWRGSGLVVRGDARQLAEHLHRTDPRLLTPEVQAVLDAQGPRA